MHHNVSRETDSLAAALEIPGFMNSHRIIAILPPGCPSPSVTSRNTLDLRVLRQINEPKTMSTHQECKIEL
jgi:hypothetical protein